MLTRLLFILFLAQSLFANTYMSTLQGDVLAKNLHLYAGSKAKIQWQRVFSSQRRMQRYKIDALSSEEQRALKNYLLNHAADSDQPIVPGL